MVKFFFALCLLFSGSVFANTETNGLPSCDDAYLVKTVKFAIEEYNDNNPVSSLYERRKRLLQIKNINTFAEENTEDYKSSQDKVVSDKVLMTKINNGLTNAEIRICKTENNLNMKFDPVYLVIYKDKYDLIQVSILNYIKTGDKELNIIYD